MKLVTALAGSVTEAGRQKFASVNELEVILPFASVTEVATPPVQFQTVEVERLSGRLTLVGNAFPHVVVASG